MKAVKKMSRKLSAKSAKRKEEGSRTSTRSCATTEDQTPGKSPKSDGSLLAMERFARSVNAKRIEGLQADFATLATFVPEDSAAVACSNNKTRNRYNNIPCFDKSRVELRYQVPPETDYVHANYVTTEQVRLSNRFICAQAPMEHTMGDFWRLIWQERPKHILMLCRLVENGKPKCAPYFPEGPGQQREFCGIVIQFVRAFNQEEKAYDSINLRVSVGLDGFLLTLHRWNDWPDFGVPPNGMGLLRLLRQVRTDPKCLALIHCSAGVGRTGTVMVLEMAVRALLEGKEPNMLELVKECRRSRACAVQTEGQYVFVHRALFEFIKAKRAARGEIAAFTQQYGEYKKTFESQTPQMVPVPAVPSNVPSSGRNPSRERDSKPPAPAQTPTPSPTPPAPTARAPPPPPPHQPAAPAPPLRNASREKEAKP